MRKSNPQNNMRNNLFYLLMIALMPVFFTACHRSSNNHAGLRCVEVITPAPLSGEEVFTFPGKIKETKQVNVAFKTGGAIEEVYVQVGDHVRKGQLLARIDDADYLLGVRNDEALYNHMKDEVERLQVLYEHKSISKNDYEKALVGMTQLEVALQASRNRVNYCKLYAPADGVILAVNYHAAELVDAGMAVFSLLEDTELQVIFDIPAQVYQKRASFGPIYSRASFEPDKRVAMSLAAITPKADNNQLYRVYLDFKDHADKRFTPGTSVQVDVCCQADASHAQGVSVPLRTVCMREDKPFVWVLNPDRTLLPKEVVIAGVDAQGNARISSGLDGSETLVKAGAATLQAGEKVRVIETRSQSNIGDQL